MSTIHLQLAVALVLFVLAVPAHAAPPTADTQAAYEITPIKARIQASVNAQGTPIQVYFEWGTTTNLGNATGSLSFVAVGNSPFPVTEDLVFLTPDTTYYFRGIAFNGNGTSYGAILSFRTSIALPPSIISQATSAITASAATIGASVHPQGTPTEVYFEWGATTNLGSVTGMRFPSPLVSPISVTWGLTGLTANTTYYFRAVASNMGGSNVGGIASFKTTGPVATTLNATNIGSFKATLAGIAHPPGGVRAYFEYGQSAGYGSFTSTQTVSISGTSYVTATISNLLDYTDYHFRLVVITNSTPVYGDNRTFRTIITPAVVVTLHATNVTGTNANLVGTVTPNSLVGAFLVSFEIGTTISYGQSTVMANTSGGISPNPVQIPVSNLNPGMLYHFRLKFDKVQTGETYYGSDQTFTTLHIPTAVTEPATVATNIITLNGWVNPNGAPANVRFAWGPTTAYGSTTSVQVLPSGSVPVPVSATHQTCALHTWPW